MAFSSHGQKLLLLCWRKGGGLGRGALAAVTSSPAGHGVSLAAGAALVGQPGQARHCRAGLSLPGACLQQPGCVGCPGTRGVGSVAHPAVGAKASTMQGG